MQLNIDMSKFLQVIAESHPNYAGNSKRKLMDFLTSKGIHTASYQGTNKLQIDIGEGINIVVDVMDLEEDSQETNDIVNDTASTQGT